jgi:hypothetical protein
MRQVLFLPVHHVWSAQFREIEVLPVGHDIFAIECPYWRREQRGYRKQREESRL